MKTTLTLIAVCISLNSFSQNLVRTNDFVDLKYGIHIPTNGHPVGGVNVFIWNTNTSYNTSDNLTTALKEKSIANTESKYSGTIKDLISIHLEGLVQDIEDSGAGYVVLNLGQSDGKYCSPNVEYENLMFNVSGGSSGFLTPKIEGTDPKVYDLPLALSNKLESLGIKLFLYLNLDGPTLLKGYRQMPDENGNPVFEEFFIAEDRMGLEVTTGYVDCVVIDGILDCGGVETFTSPVGFPVRACTGEFDPDDANGTIFRLYKPVGTNRFRHFSITQEHVDNMVLIINEWSLRYGDKVSGWFFDHSFSGWPYKANGNDHGFTDAYLSQIKNAALAGNSDNIVTFSDGVINPNPGGLNNTVDYTVYQDFTWGETPPRFKPVGESERSLTLNEIQEIWQDDQNVIGENLFQGRRVVDNASSPTHWSQTHFIIPMASDWGNPDVNLEKKAILFYPYLYEAIKENHVTTISIANVLNPGTFGKIPDAQLDELKLINTFVNVDNCDYEDNAVVIPNVYSGWHIKAPEANTDFVVQDIPGIRNKWIIEVLDDDFNGSGNELIRIFNIDTHKSIKVKNGTTIGTEIIQNYWNDWESQRWIKTELGNDFVSLQTLLHNDRYLSSQGALVNTNLIINDWTDNNRQKWVIPNSGSRIAAPIKETIKFYPNPTHNLVSIVLNKDSKDQIKKVEILDSNGLLVSTENSIQTKSYLANLLEFKNGLYIIKIYTNQNIYTKKIIKQ